MSEAQAFADAFVNWYFQNFNENKEALADVYGEGTLITFQDFQISGVNQRGVLNIMDRFLSPGLQGMTMRAVTITAQPSVEGTALICVQGNCRMSPDEAEELPFYEIFIIGRTEAGGFQIINQVFSTASV